MDEFAARLLDEVDDHYDFRAAIKAWVEGDWKEAMSYLEGILNWAYQARAYSPKMAAAIFGDASFLDLKQGYKIHVYPGPHWIRQRPDRSYYLELEREEHEGELRDLEQKLWDWINDND